jgi:PAS domain S-box-containing protein
MRFLYGLDDDLVSPISPHGLAQVSAAGTILTCDEDFATVLGKTRTALEASSLASIHAGIDLEGEGNFEVAGRRVHFKWLRSVDASLPSSLLIMSSDDSHDRDARLRQSLAAFEQLVEATPVGIVVLDENKSVVLWNKAAEEIFGWTADEILGKPYPLVPPSEWNEFSKLFDRVMAGQGFRNIESTRRRKDNSEVALSMSTTPVRDSGGKPIAALALLNDLSQQRLLEEKLSERVRLEAVGQLASGVAHDFNNMLTVVSAHCGFVMRRGKLSVADQDSMAAIERCVLQASHLTNQLLTFGRKQIVRPTNLDINDSTRETVRMLTKLLGHKVKLEMDLAPGLPTCRIDSTQFSQLLVNLLTNARDAITDVGTIRASTAMGELDGEPAVVLSITDTGKGIAESSLARIFEPFFTSKKAGEGTGLGLSTAFGIAEQASGRLEARSVEGVGSTFTLSLPVSRTVDSADSQRPTTAPMDEPLSVLLVDDDDLVRETLAELMRLERHRVTAVGSGSEALALLDQGAFDVLLTDVYMPGMDGAELAGQVEARHPNLPILFMSGNLADPALRDRIEQGLASIIQKPIYPDELERALVEVVSGRVYRWS